MTGQAPIFSSPASGHVLYCGNWRKQQIWREQKTSKHTNWVWNESLNIQSNRPYLVLCSHSHFAPFSSKNMGEEQNRRTTQMCFNQSAFCNTQPHLSGFPGMQKARPQCWSSDELGPLFWFRPEDFQPGPSGSLFQVDGLGLLLKEATHTPYTHSLARLANLSLFSMVQSHVSHSVILLFKSTKYF